MPVRSIGSEATKMQRIAMNRAIREKGHSFITLELLNERLNGMHGADGLNAKPYRDGSGIHQFVFEIMPKPMQFVADDERGGFFLDLIDTERNRQFLAAHLDAHGNEHIFAVVGENRPEILADLRAIQAGEKRVTTGVHEETEEELLAKLEALRKRKAGPEHAAGDPQAKEESAMSTGSSINDQLDETTADEPGIPKETQSERMKRYHAEKKNKKDQLVNEE